MLTKILYIHGYGGKGGTGKILEGLLGTEFTVDTPKFFEPELNTAKVLQEEIEKAKQYADERKPDLIIGSSLGGFLTSFLSGYKRILINSCFRPSEFNFICENIKDESELQKLKNLEKTIPVDKNDVYGLFSENDELFKDFGKQFQEEFKKKFNPGQFFTMNDRHKISTDNIKTKLIPLIYDMIMEKEIAVMQITNNEAISKIAELTIEIKKNQNDYELLHQRAELYTQIGDYENAFNDYGREAEQKDDRSLFYVEDDDYGWCMSADFCISLLKKDIHFLDYLFYYESDDDERCRNVIKAYLSSVYTSQEDWTDIFNKTRDALEYIPLKFLTEDMCLFAVKRDDNSNTKWDSLLKYIPREKQTEAICKIAVQHSGYALHYMADKFKTPELCLLSVKHKGPVLEYVPENIKTFEICLAAVHNDGIALEYVPDSLKTKELCDTAIHGKNVASYLAFPNIPNQLKTPEMCLEIVKKWGNGLAHVPEQLITLEMCVIACQDNSWCLKYVPKNLVNEVKNICGVKENNFKG
jgi:predicted esterase YcpF (UPF0227 family)